MSRVVVVGGGMAGCGAALAAAKAGAQVTLLERTDMLVGVAVRAGETNGNGWFVANQELRFLGAGELPDALQSIKLHDSVTFPQEIWQGLRDVYSQMSCLWGQDRHGGESWRQGL